jgi:hypothetical protein
MASVAILHEGNEKNTHDNELLKLLVRELGLDENRIRFFGMKGKSNFFNEDHDTYRLLRTGIENETIEKVLVIVDADYEKNDHSYGGYDNTLKGLKKTFTSLQFTPYCDIYIMCDPNTQAGYLESFLLSTIPSHQKACIETFLACSEFKSKENHKAILNQIYNLAYPKAPFDFTHPHFDDLKTKLCNLFT